jgi:hypothetical protein
MKNKESGIILAYDIEESAFPKVATGIGPLFSISQVIYMQNSEQWPNLLL